MIKKTLIIIILALLAVPNLALGTVNNVVTFPQASTIQLDDGSSYNLDTSNTFNSFTVNATNIEFTMASSSVVALVSLDRKEFTLSGTNADYMTVSKNCENDRSILLVTVSTAAPSTYTLTVTPSGSCTGSGGSTSAPAAAAPGGGAASPATPATPAVPTESPATPATPATPASAAVSPVSVEAVISFLGVVRNTAKETQNITKVGQDLTEFKVTGTAEQKTAMNNFVTYGTSASTVKLGEGERRAVIRDYLDTVKKANITWSDIERITNGQKPVDRNLTSEQGQLPKVLNAFEKITGHRPDFKNTKEDLAWNTMMYRVRFTRDLTVEAQGIKEFKAKFNKTPSTPLDWAAVRALAYALK